MTTEQIKTISVGQLVRCTISVGCAPTYRTTTSGIVKKIIDSTPLMVEIKTPNHGYYTIAATELW